MKVLADDGLFYGALTGVAELILVRKVIVKLLGQSSSIKPLKEADGCEFEEITQMYDAMIRFFKDNPDMLDDDEYVKRIKELRWLAEEGFLKGIKL